MNTDGIYQCVKPNDESLQDMVSIGLKVPNSEDYYTIREFLGDEKNLKIFGEPTILLNEIVNEEGVYEVVSKVNGKVNRYYGEIPMPFSAFKELQVDLNVNQLMEETEIEYTSVMPLYM